PRQRALRRGTHALRLRQGSAFGDARHGRRRTVLRRAVARVVRGHASRRFEVPGELPDIVLTAGVGRGVAAAVPAYAAPLRARHPRVEAAPRAAVPDWIGTLRLERIPIMGGHLAIEVEGDTVRVLDLPEQLQIEHDPRAATML